MMNFLKKLSILCCAIALSMVGLWLRTYNDAFLNRARSYASSIFSKGGTTQGRAMRAGSQQTAPHTQTTGVLFEHCFTPHAQQEREQYVVEIVNNTNNAQFSKRNAEQNPNLIKIAGQEKEIAACTIARKIIIRPELKQRIILVCVHGTNSSSKSYGGSDDRQLTQEIKKFALHLSQHYNCGVEILPFSWSGSLKSKARATAGAALAHALQKMITFDKEIDYTQIWTFSHSHGCNVVNAMSNTLKNALQEKSIPITSIHVACPISKNEVPHVAYIDRCFHFYGAYDATQALGSILASHNSARTIEYPNATNICLMHMTKNLDHKKIKVPVVKYLPKLLYNIDSWYSPFTDLIASTPQEENAQPIVCIKDVAKVRPNTHEHEIKKAQERSKKQEEHFRKKFNQHINQQKSTRQKTMHILHSAGTELFGKPD